MGVDEVRVLTFDIGGTVFDWFGTVRTAVASVAADRGRDVDSKAFAVDWRSRMFSLLDQVRNGSLPRWNSDTLHRLALDDVAKRHGLDALTPAERTELNNTWHRLDAWPGAADSIASLRSRYTVSVLTVLSVSCAVDCSKRNDINWDMIVSCEFLDHYKPHKEAYLAALRLLKVEPENAMMVSAHDDDLLAAANAGLQTAYVAHPREYREPNDPNLKKRPAFTLTVNDFSDLANRLVQ